MYASQMPAPFLSVLIDDCIAKGRDYNAGGARYNNTFIQMVGLGSITDSLSAIQEACFAHTPRLPMAELVAILDQNFAGQEVLRQRLVNRSPKYGNDDDDADSLMRKVFDACFDEVDGRPDARGGRYRVEMLPTTCHVYFGSVVGAMPDGRKAGLPVSEGISPVQGADRHGPTAVIRSAAKMDHVKTGGTLLNMKFSPASSPARTAWTNGPAWFAATSEWTATISSSMSSPRTPSARPRPTPKQHRDLIVRVAGYSDYFCDLSTELQNEIIARTEHQTY